MTKEHLVQRLGSFIKHLGNDVPPEVIEKDLARLAREIGEGAKFEAVGAGCGPDGPPIVGREMMKYEFANPVRAILESMPTGSEIIIRRMA